MNGVVDLAGDLLLVGSKRTTVGNDRDGALVHLTAQPAGEFVGGANNDQLYAVAKSATATLAVGIARSFRGARDADQAFLLVIDGTTLTPSLHFPAADVGVQPRAVDALDGGFAIAGRFDGGTEGYLERVSNTAVPLATMRFAFPQAGDVRVRQLRTVGDVLVVVGDRTVGSQLSAFIAGFDAQTLAVRFANVASHASLDVSLSDVAQVGTLVVAVGAVGNDGLIAQFDAATGNLVTTFAVPQTTLSSVVGPATALVAGSSGASLVAARLTSTGLAGSAFSNLSNTSNISPLPMLRVDGGAVLFGLSSDAGVARIDLNDAMEAACAGAVTGSAFTRTFQLDAGVQVAPVTLTVTPVTLQSAAVPNLTRTNVPLTTSAACWP